MVLLLYIQYHVHTMEYVILSVKVRDELVTQVDEELKRSDCNSRSDFVRTAIREKLARDRSYRA